MPSLRSLLLLPPALLALLPLTAAEPNPTALRKPSPDSSEKLFPEHLAFAPLPELSPAQSFPQEYPSHEGGDQPSATNASTRLYQRAFAPHFGDDTHEGVLRRAAEALAILERRATCPSGMRSCADAGSPNKCCQEGTFCTEVPDSDVGHVACCPRGSQCGGSVGQCPSDTVSCPADLGGGCCISGYICQGVGCVRSGSTTTASATRPTETETTEEPSSTEVTETTTEDETATATGTDTMTDAPETTDDTSTQTGCPTGFYGCLATHGGGCCRTDRNCETHSCPAPTSTTVEDGGATVVVPADDVPASATETCADGWFMCGESGGPTAGCCPSGYDCGTASCFTVEASQTEKVQKGFPEDGAPAVASAKALLAAAVGVALIGLM